VRAHGGDSGRRRHEERTATARLGGLVRVRNGNAVLEDVLIDGRSVRGSR